MDNRKLPELSAESTTDDFILALTAAFKIKRMHPDHQYNPDQMAIIQRGVDAFNLLKARWTKIAEEKVERKLARKLHKSARIKRNYSKWKIIQTENRTTVYGDEPGSYLPEEKKILDKAKRRIRSSEEESHKDLVKERRDSIARKELGFYFRYKEPEYDKRSDDYQDIIKVLKLFAKRYEFVSPIPLPPSARSRPQASSPSGLVTSPSFATSSLFASPASVSRSPAHHEGARVDEDRLLGLITQAINDLKLILEPGDAKSEKQATARYEVFVNYIEEAPQSEINFCLGFVKELKNPQLDRLNSAVLTELEDILQGNTQAPRPR